MANLHLRQLQSCTLCVRRSFNCACADFAKEKKPYRMVGLSGGKRRDFVLMRDSLIWSPTSFMSSRRLLILWLCIFIVRSRLPLGRYFDPSTVSRQELWHEVARRHSGGDSLRQLAQVVLCFILIVYPRNWTTERPDLR